MTKKWGREENTKYQNNRRKIRKQAWIDSMGGECVVCGSKKNLGPHHKNPKKKSFSPCFSEPEDILLAELAKCSVLCSRCHRIIHSPSHGTIAKYVRGCRCDDCKKAMSQYSKAYRYKRKLLLKTS